MNSRISNFQIEIWILTSDNPIFYTIATMGNTNSASKDEPAADPCGTGPSDMSNKVALGAGCYWGTDKFVRKSTFFLKEVALCVLPATNTKVPCSAHPIDPDFEKMFPGAIKQEETNVGFMSPDDDPRIKKPTYKQVNLTRPAAPMICDPACGSTNNNFVFS